MANTKLQLEVEVDEKGAIRGLQLVQEQLKKTGDATDEASKRSAKFEGFANNVQNFITDPLGSAGEAAKSFLTALGPVGTGVAAVGATIAALGVAGYGAAKSLGALGDRLGDTGARLGTTAKEAYQIEFAMKRAGGSIEAVEATLRKLSQGLDDASEEGTKTRKALADISVATRDIEGNARPIVAVFADVARALTAIEDPAKRNSTAIQIFGRSALEILPDLERFADGLKRAKDLGLGPDDASIKRWDEYHEQITEAEELFDQLVRKVKEPLASTFVITFKTIRDLGPQEGAAPAAAQQQFREQRGLAPQTSDIFRLVNEAFGQAARLNQSAARSLAAALDTGLEGTREKLQDLKEAYDNARTAADSVAKSGAVLPRVAEEHMSKVDAARLAYERQADIVKLLAKDEAQRVANLEKIRDILRSNTPENSRLLRIGPGTPTETIITPQEFASANNPSRLRVPPTLSRRGEIPAPGAPDLRQGLQTIIGQASILEIVSAILNGTAPSSIVRGFVSPASSRIDLTRSTFEALTARTEGVTGLRRDDIQVRVTAIQAEAAATERIIALRAGPNGEIATALQVAEVRRKAIEDEYRLTGDVVRFREASLQNEAELRVRIAEEQRRQTEAIKGTLSGLFETALLDPDSIKSALTQTLKSAIVRPIAESASEAVSGAIRPVIFGRQGDGGFAGFFRNLFGQRGEKTDPSATLQMSAANVQLTAASTFSAAVASFAAANTAATAASTVAVTSGGDIAGSLISGFRSALDRFTPSAVATKQTEPSRPVSEPARPAPVSVVQSTAPQVPVPAAALPPVRAVSQPPSEPEEPRSTTAFRNVFNPRTQTFNLEEIPVFRVTTTAAAPVAPLPTPPQVAPAPTQFPPLTSRFEAPTPLPRFLGPLPSILPTSTTTPQFSPLPTIAPPPPQQPLAPFQPPIVQRSGFNPFASAFAFEDFAFNDRAVDTSRPSLQPRTAFSTVPRSIGAVPSVEEAFAFPQIEAQQPEYRNVFNRQTQTFDLVDQSGRLVRNRGRAEQFFGGMGLAATEGLGVLPGIFGGSVQTGPGQATALTTTERIGAAAGLAATGVTGGLAIYQAAKHGGAKDIVAASLATAAALDPEPISKAALAIAASLVSVFGGNPKKAYDERETRLLEAARYEAPDAMSYTFDVAGRAFDYDFRGNARSYGDTYNVTVNAMDPQSFDDFARRNAGTFGEVVRTQVSEYGPLRQEIQSTAIPI